MSEKGKGGKNTTNRAPMTKTAAARIQSSAASKNGGCVAKQDFASRAQAAAAKKENGK